MDHLQRDKLVSALLEASDDGSNKVALDAVRLQANVCVTKSPPKALNIISYLNHDVGLFHGHVGCFAERTEKR